MKFDERRPERQRRGSTRNASSGVGRNEPPSKPPLRGKEETAPVRKPKFPTGKKKPKEERAENPGKIREPKPKGMSLSNPVKMLTEFNVLVNHMVVAGLHLVESAGGFSKVEQKQQDLLKKFRGMEKDTLPPELKDSFELLEKTTRSQRYVRKVPIRNPKSGGRKFRYIYEREEKS